MFGLGWPELGLIGLAALIVLGPKKIPELGSALGKTLRGFKKELYTSEADDVREEGEEGERAKRAEEQPFDNAQGKRSRGAEENS
ncbi:MAG: twin-arginine translocase TatA/TatE family subunit [Cyanosarcina radialis HA8281-LM2]|jgi:sec-independent protein translocase protein TatA|nr:twin-arginine translocase TatA/TatE family subunit [Cyanosarcina radialis HA8281-LM2]